MPRLRENERIQALMQLTAGVSVADVARQFNCHRHTITNLIQRFNQNGNVRDRPRSGRPKVTTARQDRYLTLTHLRHRFKTATSTAGELGVSRDTVVRRLRANAYPIKARRPYVGQVLSNRNRALRLVWARRHLRWNRAMWSRVLFSDESRFKLSMADGRVRVFRRRGERFHHNCLLERDRFGGGSVMVWGGIMGGRKTGLVFINGNLNAQGYVDQVLRPVVVPFLQQNPGCLMHDNARPHTAALTRNYLTRHNVNVLPWPACSPDMNPIEHLWDLVGRKARKNHVINNINDLSAALVHEWNAIPADVIRHYVRSMRSRALALIRRRGGHNRY